MFWRVRLATGYLLMIFMLTCHMFSTWSANHVENQQSAVFGDHSDIQDILSNEKHSTLTGWFVANRKFPSAPVISYLNFPEYFVWDKNQAGMEAASEGTWYYD